MFRSNRSGHQLNGAAAAVGAPDYETMVKAVVEVGADGFNGDTMVGINASFMATAAGLGRPLSLEPECGIADLADLATDVSTWGYWDNTGPNSSGTNGLAPPVWPIALQRPSPLLEQLSRIPAREPRAC